MDFLDFLERLWTSLGDVNGGQGGIRTLDGLAPMPLFESGAFNLSATCPQIMGIYKEGAGAFQVKRQGA